MAGVEAARIAGAIELLVVRARDASEHAERADAPEDLLGVQRMALHRGPFQRIELARLVEDLVAHPELADVVQQRGAAQPAALVDAQAQLFGDLVGDQRHARAVARGERALGVDDLAEGERDVVEVVGVDRLQLLRRLHLEDAQLQIGAGQLAPEPGVARQHREGIGQPRVEPDAAAARHLFARGLRAGTGVEHLHPLGQQRDARIQRDLRAGQALWLAAAVPVFVQALDAVGHVLAEAQLARDLRAARATRLGEFAVDLAAVLHGVRDGADALGEAGLDARVPDDEVHQAGQAQAHRPAVALEREVVGEEQLADARGIAAAARILQQRHVVQLAHLERVQSDRAADLLADPATAHAVAGRLAFRHVQRMAQRAQQLAQARAVAGGRTRGRCRQVGRPAMGGAGGIGVGQVELGVHSGSIGACTVRLKAANVRRVAVRGPAGSSISAANRSISS